MLWHHNHLVRLLRRGLALRPPEQLIRYRGGACRSITFRNDFHFLLDGEPRLPQRFPIGRSIVHLPILGAGAKFFVAFALKKIAVTTLIQRYGLRNTFQKLHEINAMLFKTSDNSSYTVHAFRAVDSSLTTLEEGMLTLSESEQVIAIWEWLQNIEKDNPSFVTHVVKVYLEAMPPYKWMRTVMSGASEAQILHGSGSPRSSSIVQMGDAADNVASGTPVDAGVIRNDPLRGATATSDRNSDLLTERIHAEHPDIERIYAANPDIRERFHVILLSRTEGDDDDNRRNQK